MVTLILALFLTLGVPVIIAFAVVFTVRRDNTELGLPSMSLRPASPDGPATVLHPVVTAHYDNNHDRAAAMVKAMRIDDYTMYRNRWIKDGDWEALYLMTRHVTL
jgi:hypothetical protein